MMILRLLVLPAGAGERRRAKPASAAKGCLALLRVPSSEPDATAIPHEQGLALFIQPIYRRRFREDLSNRRRREKLRRKLSHFDRLDPRFVTAVKSTEQRSDVLGRMLRQRGASERCHLLSEDPALDARSMGLEEALAEVVDAGRDFATFISCVPGKLAYFHGEELENRCILHRRD